MYLFIYDNIKIYSLPQKFVSVLSFFQQYRVPETKSETFEKIAMQWHMMRKNWPIVWDSDGYIKALWRRPGIG